MVQLDPGKILGKSLIVVGAGGNIGSHLGPHLARLADPEQITLIDPDTYQEKNLFSQDITPRNVGRPKAIVQAQRLRRINPNVRVHTMQDFIENVPLGKLQADLILACLDSREARRYTNQVAWRLGIPWIDAGVEAEGLLARVNVYVPGPEAPCLECAWDERDYAALEQTYPCQGKTDEPVPTNAPSSLGALAASLQALEAQKFLAGHLDWVAVGQQVLIDASFHQHYVTTFQRNPQCRFDHAIWPIKKVGCQPRALTLHQILKLGALARKKDRKNNPLTLRVEGNVFVRKLTCFSCGQTWRLLRLNSRLRPNEQTCSCGHPMVAAGFDMAECLDANSLSHQELKRSLSSIGLRPGDVVTVVGPVGQAHGESHYQLGG